MARSMFEVLMPAVVLVIAGNILGWAIAAVLRRRRERRQREADAEIDRHMRLGNEAYRFGNVERAEFHQEQASLLLDRALGLKRPDSGPS